MGGAPFFETEPTIFIIESPNADDVFYERTEGRALSAALKLAQIDNTYHTALDKKSFERALFTAAHRIGDSVRTIRPHVVPIIHVSAHGNSDGLGLTSGELVTWSMLRDMLHSFLDEATDTADKVDSLSLTSLCLSTCHGGCGSKMFELGQPYPCLGLVGPTEDVEWPDSLTAFVTFYHQLFYKHALVSHAVEAMNRAAGISSFRAFFPPDIQEHFRSYGLFISSELEHRLTHRT